MPGFVPGHFRPASSLGGAVSPGHSMRNAIGRFEGIQWPTNISPYQKYAMGVANPRGGSNAPQRQRPPRVAGRGNNPVLGLLNRLVGGVNGGGRSGGAGGGLRGGAGGGLRGGAGGGLRGGALDPGGVNGGGRSGGAGGGLRGGALDPIRSQIGTQMQSPPVQEFLPEWLTQQTQNDIAAQAHQRFNPAQMMQQKVGSRGIGMTSGSALSSVGRAQTSGLDEAARIGAETGLSDHLERQRFDIRHALARHQDVTQGARNQALRDQIAMRGGQNDFNQILALIGMLS